MHSRFMVTSLSYMVRKQVRLHGPQYSNIDSNIANRGIEIRWLLAMLSYQRSQVGKHFWKCHPPGQSDVTPFPLRIKLVFVLP